jgi:hypothetical protein
VRQTLKQDFPMSNLHLRPKYTQQIIKGSHCTSHLGSGTPLDTPGNCSKLEELGQYARSLGDTALVPGPGLDFQQNLNKVPLLLYILSCPICKMGTVLHSALCDKPCRMAEKKNSLKTEKGWT